MRTRRAQPRNAALNIELHRLYSNKAKRCGMSLDAYCLRFHVTRTWEK